MKVQISIMLILGIVTLLYGCAGNEQANDSVYYGEMQNESRTVIGSSAQNEMTVSQQAEDLEDTVSGVSEEYEKIQDGYLVNGLCTIENGALVDATERFWVKSSYTDGKDYLLCTDISGRIWGKQEYGGQAIPRLMITEELTAFELFKEGRYVILDLLGNDRTYDFIHEDEYITCVEEDSTGISIVCIKEENTYSSQNIIYTFYDLDRNVKLTCDRISMEEEYNIEWTNFDKSINYVGGAMYCIQDVTTGYDLFMNVSSGETRTIYVNEILSGQYISADDNTTLIFKPYVGAMMMDNVDGRTYRISTEVDNETYTPCSPINEGLFCGSYELSIGFYKYLVFDTKGEVAIDLNYPDTRIKEYVNFKNGRALLFLMNDAKVPYVTIMDMNGEWLFEPIQGMPIRTNMLEQGYCEETGFYLLQADEGTAQAYLLDSEGNLEEIDLPFTNQYESNKYQLDVSGILFSYIDNQLYCIYFKDNTITRFSV